MQQLNLGAKKLLKKILNEQSEIDDLYLNGRMITSEEAYWRIMEFPIIEILPSTEVLPVHLPKEKYVETTGLNEYKDLKNAVSNLTCCVWVCGKIY